MSGFLWGHGAHDDVMNSSRMNNLQTKMFTFSVGTVCFCLQYSPWWPQLWPKITIWRLLKICFLSFISSEILKSGSAGIQNLGGLDSIFNLLRTSKLAYQTAGQMQPKIWWFSKLDMWKSLTSKNKPKIWTFSSNSKKFAKIFFAYDSQRRSPPCPRNLRTSLSFMI